MAELNFNNKDVFGGVNFNGEEEKKETANNVFGSFFETSGTENFVKAEGVGTTSEPNTTFRYDTIEKNKAITKQGLWSKIKAFLFQEIDLTAPIKVELTPYQKKVEKEINDFLHQDVSFKAIAKLFK